MRANPEVRTIIDGRKRLKTEFYILFFPLPSTDFRHSYLALSIRAINSSSTDRGTEVHGRTMKWAQVLLPTEMRSWRKYERIDENTMKIHSSTLLPFEISGMTDFSLETILLQSCFSIRIYNDNFTQGNLGHVVALESGVSHPGTQCSLLPKLHVTNIDNSWL